MVLHDACGIIMELLGVYPRCCKCRAAATRVARPTAIIIGDNPLFCDSCDHPPDWKTEDLPQAELIRTAEHYLDTHGTKT
jgi:hypothetical protein